MPELPDLHVFAKNLKKSILDQNITSAEVFNSFKVNAATPTFNEQLAGASIRDIVREGKELSFKLSNSNSFNVHLMLNGKFTLCGIDELHKINSKIVAVCFENGQALAVSDYQGMCKVTLNPKAASVPDALSERFTYEYFFETIKRNARVNIKSFLIDQHIVRGIGNAYADEILWKADISPESVAGKIPEDYLKSLYNAIPFILNDAIQNIERISPDIISGEERSFLKVHNPKKKCTDEGDTIIVGKVASKKTYYTEKQKLFK